MAKSAKTGVSSRELQLLVCQPSLSLGAHFANFLSCPTQRLSPPRALSQTEQMSPG